MLNETTDTALTILAHLIIADTKANSLGGAIEGASAPGRGYSDGQKAFWLDAIGLREAPGEVYDLAYERNAVRRIKAALRRAM